MKHKKYIHLFQDSNGRVEKLIIFKECLKYNIVPLSYRWKYKLFYYKDLKEYENEKSYLIDITYMLKIDLKKY